MDQILETKRIEIQISVQKVSYAAIYRRAKAVTRRVVSFSDALHTSQPSIIAEFKRKSPSKGFINEAAEPAVVVRGYTEKGAAAISVLTDREYFGGFPDDLLMAREVTPLPLLRKDFFIDPYQICEARIAGADVILLIAAAMRREECLFLAEFARELGLEVLLEIHNEPELEYINPFVNVVGVNNRNLTTFVTNTAVSEKLTAMIPEQYLKISESCLSSPDTVKRLYNMGYNGFLMGGHFMKDADPASALEQFLSWL